MTKRIYSTPSVDEMSVGAEKGFVLSAGGTHDGLFDDGNIDGFN